MLLRFLVVPVDLVDSGVIGVEGVDKRVPPLDQRFVRRALDDELDRLAAAGAASEARRHVGEGAHARDVAKTAVDVVDDLEAVATMSPFRQHDLDRSGVEAAAARTEAARRAHRNALDLAIGVLWRLHQRHETRFDLLDEGLHVLEGGAFGARDHDLERAAVLVRGVFPRDLGEQEITAADDREEGNRDGDRALHGGVVDCAIAVAQACECAVHEACEALWLLIRRMCLE